LLEVCRFVQVDLVHSLLGGASAYRELVAAGSTSGNGSRLGNKIRPPLV
jgi:hypothetical protein